ncbi:hypothetical protein Tel_15155 [Candidatus Tenderia electrophaga]|jgi:hypothetical protein|uniref:SIMPL domain-containing protein n=1 Tax=Candidatus Tenderia electrophaga TaxID=1748243 RepID=A0A0S2TGW0_9GAMM|nr:hypothetical protein Tel_15155 [Candidatus Tenderia electrophaga]
MHKIAATLLYALPLLANAAPELSGTPHELSQYLLDQKKIIAIEGEAEEKVEADRAVVSIAVRTKENKLQDALQKNEALRHTLRQQLQQAGIDAEAIRASNFSSTPDYGWFGDKPSSYEVSNEVKISIRNEAQLQTIARLVDSHKEIFLGTMTFEDSAAATNTLKVLEKALTMVQDKRALYEGQLGVTLQPIRVSTPQVFARTPQLQRMAPAKPGQEGISNTADTAPASGDFGGITYGANTLVEFVVQSGK